MPALTVNRLACTVYGLLFVLLGIETVLWSKDLASVLIYGLCDNPDLQELLASEGLDRKTLESYVGYFGGAVVAFGLLQALVGVLAFLRQLWVMIVGTALAVLFFSYLHLHKGFAVIMSAHKLDLAYTVAFVLLTIVAVVSRRKRSPQTSFAEAKALNPRVA